MLAQTWSRLGGARCAGVHRFDVGPAGDAVPTAHAFEHGDANAELGCRLFTGLQMGEGVKNTCQRCWAGLRKCLGWTRCVAMAINAGAGLTK
jgi:hypothetical protein